MVTIRDIEKKSGYSTATISRLLRMISHFLLHLIQNKIIVTAKSLRYDLTKSRPLFTGLQFYFGYPKTSKRRCLLPAC